MGTIFVDMLSSDKPNPRFLQYYGECSDDVEEFYKKTINLIISYHISLDAIILTILNNQEFIYYFLGDDEEYEKYLKLLFSNFSKFNIKMTLDNMKQYGNYIVDKTWWENFFILKYRLESDSNDKFNEKMKKLESDVLNSILNQKISMGYHF
jgi:hypothetical protein